MYLKCRRRIKDGKEHRYWSIAENRRCADGRIGDRHLPYLGEINDRLEFSRPTRLDASGGAEWMCRTISDRSSQHDEPHLAKGEDLR